MRRGFTLLEVLLASVILGVGLAGVLVSMSQAQRMMRTLPEIETAQEVMDLGNAAFPLSEITEVDDIDVSAVEVDELWGIIAGAHGAEMTGEQKEKYENFTWEREVVDKNPDEKELKRVGYVYPVRVTVKWGRKEGQRESYVTLWRDPNR